MSVRLMSFNTMLLPPVIETAGFDPSKLVWREGEARAQAIGDAVSDDPWAEITGFIEVWSDLGRLKAGATLTRDILASALGGRYQFVSPRVPDTIAVLSGKLADSGLVLFAKHDPVPLPQPLPPQYMTPDARIGFVEFSAASGSDALVSKGALLARFETGHGYVTVVLTHLQASYDAIDQYAGDRKAQLAQIEQLLTAALGSPPWPVHEHVVIMGDLNIGAILHPVPDEPELVVNSPEYDRVFRVDSSLIQSNFQDGWMKFMPQADRGITQHAWNNEHPEVDLQRNRLDYHLLYDPRPPAPPANYVVSGGQAIPKLALQHMRIVHRTLSDHFAVRGDLNEWRKWSSPAFADQVPETEKNANRAINVEQVGQMMWLRFKPGPYTFVWLPELDVSLYLESNISDPWPPYKKDIDLSRIPGAAAASHRSGLPHVGTLFSMPEPFYVRVVAPDQYRGKLAVGWHRHEGISKDDAIPLRAQAPPRPTDFPDGRPLNDRDEQWFQVKVGQALGASVHSSLFYVDNHTQSEVSFSLRSASGHELYFHAPSAGPRLEVSWPDQGEADGKHFFLVVTRSSTDQTLLDVGWKTALTYLWPLQLRCDEETGLANWLGADEISAQLSGDGYDAGTRDNDDMDAGESMLFEDTPGSKRGWLPFAYINHAEIRVVEHDPPVGDVDGSSGIAPLAEDVSTSEENVGMDVGSGHYTFLYRRSHTRPGD